MEAEILGTGPSRNCYQGEADLPGIASTGGFSGLEPRKETSGVGDISTGLSVGIDSQDGGLGGIGAMNSSGSVMSVEPDSQMGGVGGSSTGMPVGTEFEKGTVAGSGSSAPSDSKHNNNGVVDDGVWQLLGSEYLAYRKLQLKNEKGVRVVSTQQAVREASAFLKRSKSKSPSYL